MVAAAAYRSGERLEDERTGEIFDYRARGGVVDTFILARNDAPEWAHDRARLWNEAERGEHRSNGRIANEIVLALPHELDAATRKQILKDYLEPLVEKHGVAIDVAIHEPGQGRDARNVHAHVLITHRELGADGFGDIANERTIQKKVKLKGQEVSAYKARSIAGIAATPEDVTALRRDWEKVVNRAYERAGLDIHVDHRSHEDRGLDQKPTIHLGPAAAEIEKRQPGMSDRAAINHGIAAHNAALKNIPALEAEVKQLSAQIIDLAAERAMREQRDAAKGRYDMTGAPPPPARDAAPGRYDELNAATPPPEVAREFASNANRTAEPAAPVWDRDRDNAAWEAKLADTAQEAAQQPADRAGVEVGAAPSGAKNAAHPHDTRPLGKTASDILTAWTLSRSASQFEDALAARGISLAVISPAEAEQSQRTAAFAKEVGGFAPLLNAGEIVAVNDHGNVHRLNPHTTGDASPDIEAKFPGIDRATLLNVADTKEVMREAAHETWRDEAHAWREMNTPLTSIETTIADALMNTMTGTEFAEALDKAGLTIARASNLDAQALDALRDEARLASLMAFTENDNIDRDARHYDKLAEGDYAAVTRSGDVFRLNPTTLDFEEAEQRLADVQPHMPSVIEARARNEINRETIAELWTDLRAWNAEVTSEREKAREGDRALHDHVAAAEHAVEATLETTDDAFDEGLHVASRFGHGLAKAVENILGGIFSFFGVAEPKLTPMQAQLAAQAKQELADERAVMAEFQEKEAAQDWVIYQQDRQQQREALEEEMGYRERPGGREREREREWP